MQMFSLQDPDKLRNLAAKFRQTAHAASGIDPSRLVDVLALDLLIKADLIDRLTHLIPDLTVR